MLAKYVLFNFYSRKSRKPYKQAMIQSKNEIFGQDSQKHCIVLARQMLGLLIRKKIKMPARIGNIPNLVLSPQLEQRLIDSPSISIDQKTAIKPISKRLKGHIAALKVEILTWWTFFKNKLQLYDDSLLIFTF